MGWASTPGSARKFLRAGIGYGGCCFPKDVSALKQLAGNTGYHFQLLTAVIEVNELQKRRTIGKLQKHLGSLVGKEIALLGLAFKPNTDDIREATSLVLAGRLQGEGANVRVYDPVASDARDAMLGGARIVRLGARGARRRRRRRARDRVARVRASSTGPARSKARMRVPLVVDGRNFLDRERSARPASRTRASGARCRRSCSPGARARGCGRSPHHAQAGDAAGRPAVPLVHARLAARHGVDEVILSCGFLSDGVERVLGDIHERHAPALRGRGGAARHGRAGAAGRSTRACSRSACSC